MRYVTLDADQQKQVLLQELNRLEAEHFRLSTSDPEPVQDTASYNQQKDLEGRIKSLQAAVKELEDPENANKKATRARKAAAKAAGSSETEDDSTDDK